MQLFNAVIDLETVDALKEAIEQGISKEPIVEVYITSEGGDYYAKNVLLDYLESVKEYIVIVASQFIHSAALELFIQFTGKKRVMPHTYATAHIPSISIPESRELRDKKSMTYFMVNSVISEVVKDSYKLLKESGLLTDKQLRQYNKGEDVYIAYRTLKQLENIDD